MLSLLRNNVFRPSNCQNRQFWKWLNVIFNRPDFDRIKKVGPDRSCAEWLLKNGAHVKWVHDPHIVRDFNDLSKGTIGCLLHQVYAENASISHYGFIHFAGCKHIDKIVFDNCETIDDKAMEELKFVQESPLESLVIHSCHSITDDGLKRLPTFKHLKTLSLGNLLGVQRILLCADHLQKQMPNVELLVNGNKWKDDTNIKSNA